MLFIIIAQCKLHTFATLKLSSDVFSFSGHPWICENGVAPDRALDAAVLSRLKQFSAMNKLKKMALRVSACRRLKHSITHFVSVLAFLRCFTRAVFGFVFGMRIYSSHIRSLKSQGPLYSSC